MVPFMLDKIKHFTGKMAANATVRLILQILMFCLFKNLMLSFINP